MIHDLGNKIKVVNALDATAISTDTTTSGAVIDTQGFGSGAVLVRVAAFTDGSYIINMQEGDAPNLSDAADIPAARISNTAQALTAVDETDKIGFIANKRYVRVQVDSSSTSSGATLLGNCILSDPDLGPVGTHSITA